VQAPTQSHVIELQHCHGVPPDHSADAARFCDQVRRNVGSRPAAGCDIEGFSGANSQCPLMRRRVVAQQLRPLPSRGSSRTRPLPPACRSTPQMPTALRRAALSLGGCQCKQRALLKRLRASRANKRGAPPRHSTYFRSTRPLVFSRTPPLKDAAVKPLKPASAFALFAPSGYDSFFTTALLIMPIARLNISLSAGEGCRRARRPLGIFPIRDRRQRMRWVRNLIGCTQTGLRVATRFRKRLRMPGRVC
jgi:hypothetical protein